MMPPKNPIKLPKIRCRPERQSKPQAVCSTCGTLECICRPRFYAGQLLTEEDLQRLNHYIVKKNRLHNRYLHGAGVVGGLEVVCDDCEGMVMVMPGYAISPCGDDIIVCQPERLDIIEMINACRRTKTSENCPPRKRVREKDLGNIRETLETEPMNQVMLGRSLEEAPVSGPKYTPQEAFVEGAAAPRRSDRSKYEYWCVTIRYHEYEARPSQALNMGNRQVSAKSCSCGGQCNCVSSSNSKNCSCGQASGKRSNCSCSGGTSAGSLNNAMHSQRQAQSRTQSAPYCEPNSICESYRLDIFQTNTAPSNFTESLLPLFMSREGKYGDNSGDTAAQRFWKALERTLKETDFSGTLFDSIRNCLQFVENRMQGQNFEGLFQLIASPPVQGDTQLREAGEVQDVSATVFAFHNAVEALYRENPMNTNCSMERVLRSINFYSLDTRGYRNQLAHDRLGEETFHSIALLVQYIIDCICMSLLPALPKDPESEHLVLACLTIVDDEIVDICNFACREFSGSFPNIFWWVSAVPIIPFVRSLIDWVCCSEPLVRVNSPVVNDLLNLFNMVDPTREKTRELSKNNFAALRKMGKSLREFMGPRSPSGSDPETEEGLASSYTDESELREAKKKSKASTESEAEPLAAINEMRAEIKQLRAEINKLKRGRSRED